MLKLVQYMYFSTIYVNDEIVFALGTGGRMSQRVDGLAVRTYMLLAHHHLRRWTTKKLSATI